MPKKRRSSTSRQPNSAPQGLWKSLMRIFILTVIWSAVVIVCFVSYCALGLPDIHQITQPQRRPSIVLEANDGTVFEHYGDLVGEHITLKEVPVYLPEAIMAIEDRRFYSHFGIDVLGIMRAALRNVVAGHLVQGGSTLTQQLAKNLFLSPDRTIKRKVQEMLLALWLEHTYTKDQIMTAYLNRVYLGSGSYGVDAAARTYFDKPVREISLGEAAILAGLLRAPSRLAPSHDAIQATRRAKTVLEAMLESGYINGEQKKQAVLSLASEKYKTSAVISVGRYFGDWVTDQIAPLVEDTAQDIIVRTTLDVALEQAAEKHIEAVLTGQNVHDVSQVALITLAPDGAVRALIGGRDYRQSQFNRATQAMRQPGSAFKPIVYLAAIDQGLKPDDILQDEPITLGHWSPENFDGKFRGSVTATEALAESINTVAVRVFLRAGVDHVIDTAHALGISSPLEHDPALALGASEVTPLELTGAYASLAAGGRAITPYAIKDIRNRQGQVLYTHQDVTPPVMVSTSAVDTLVTMMEQVVKTGTGKRAALEGHPVAGKTGTSSDYRDAWFVGFTADYTTGIWLGNDDGHPMHKIVGGSLPAQLWHDYMTDAEKNLPDHDLFSRGGFVGALSHEISKSFSDFVNDIVGHDSTP